MAVLVTNNVTITTSLLMLLLASVIIIDMAAAAAAAGANGNTTTCDFVSQHPRAKMDVQGSCQTSLDAMVQCLTYLLEQVPQPTDDCCAEVVETWETHPACMCMLTFYPPGRNISEDVAGAMPGLCRLDADLCGQCPALLGLNNMPGASEKKSKRRLVPLVAGILIGLLTLVALVLALLLWRRRVRSPCPPQLHADCDEILKMEEKTNVFAYDVLKAATKNFHISCKLGEGGFGVVYKGVFQDGTEVAVKQLSTKSRQGNEEFLNEVTLITGVQHRNLVKLRGCCVKGPERLLVYEYLENKSLHQALFDPGKRLHLDWPTRVKILVGTARGLAYLHEGCQTRIVHRDIKSSNILLDKDLNAKIADFGLARLFTEDQSHVSTRVAGTAGYLSPEYAMRGQLTEKADVFSYGIVALELVSGRSNFDVCLPTEEAYLLDWTWTLHGMGKVLAVLDPTLAEKAHSNNEEVIRVIEVALLCTQSVASMRPSMTRVASMLTGDSDVETGKITQPSVHTFSSSQLSSNTSRRDLLLPPGGEDSHSSHPSRNVSKTSTVDPR